MGETAIQYWRGYKLIKKFLVLDVLDVENGIATLTPIQASPGELNHTAGYGTEPVQVPKIEANSTYRTLGARISPSGCSKEATQYLREQSVEYASQVTGSYFSREAALWSFLLYFIPQVGYSIPVLSFIRTKLS
jgi:hypothetical protein